MPLDLILDLGLGLHYYLYILGYVRNLGTFILEHVSEIMADAIY